MENPGFTQSLLVTHYENTTFAARKRTTARRGRNSSTGGSASRRPQAARPEGTPP